MIFVGDIALPLKNSITYSDFPVDLYSKKWFGNLEGAIESNGNNKINTVFNNDEAIRELISDFNFAGIALSNNHILDSGTLDNTVNFLLENNIQYCGIGRNKTEANKELVVYDNGVQIIIINFGWEVIQCEITLGNKIGVNPLRKDHVLSTIKKLSIKYPKGKIVPFMHWSYELEAEPQPFERELARKMIDIGVAGVIGSHPHRVGGFEVYKDRPIVYSLGNWLFKQNYYFDGQLSLPDFCNLELAFEWDLKNHTYQFHFFNFDRDKSILNYSRTEDEYSPTMLHHTPFLNLSEKEYRIWYKKNHYHIKKGLPIYYWDDSPWQIKMKNSWNKIRDKLMKLLLNKGK